MKSGVHLADIDGAEDVPGFEAGAQARRSADPLPTVTPGQELPVAGIELRKGTDQAASIVLAASVEGFE